MKEQIEQVISEELSKAINTKGYCLHTEFINDIVNRYNISVTSVIGALSRVYVSLGLKKRRVNKDIKRFFNLQCGVNAIVYYKE